MNTKSRTDLKEHFKTGAEINQQKFNDLIDSSLNLNDDQLNIDAGRVGIGTTSPAHKLQVNGPSMMIGGSDHKSAQLKISAQNTGGFGSWTSSILMEGYATRAQGIYFTDTGIPGKKWFAGINYFTGFDTYSIGYDADGGDLVQHKEKSLLTVKGSTGNVGIGTTSPSVKLEVNGNIKCTSLDQSSDQNLKENIQPLEQGLQALMNYKPVSYDWKKEDANKKRNYGFLAQDLQALHADTSIVSGSEQDHGLTISYTQLIPVLTKSIQELNEKLETLSHKVAGTA